METLVNIRQLQQVYKGKKVFVTGHTGFKGAWLVAFLHTLGATVKGYGLAPAYQSGLFKLLGPEWLGGGSIIADIRDREKLFAAVHSFAPDVVFHLAAQPLVRRSYAIPAETFEVNAIGTANLLEAISRLNGKCAAVIITTDKVYENKEQHVLYKEEDVLGGYDPYSASKACAEMVVSSFRNSFFNTHTYSTHHKSIASARAGNVIGGGDWSEDRIVPDIMRALQNDQEVAVRNPGAIRPWQHVLEPLTGYLLLGAALDNAPAIFGRAYNFGPRPEDHLTVKELVLMAIDSWGKGSWKDVSDQQQPHEATLLQLDITRAVKELKWMPKLSAAEAISWSLAWYKQPLDRQSFFTFEQIKNYLAI